MEQKAPASFGLPHGTKSSRILWSPPFEGGRKGDQKGDGRGIKRGTGGGSEGGLRATVLYYTKSAV